MADIRLWIPGLAAPGGSKTVAAYIGKDGRARASVRDAGKNNAQWRARVTRFAMDCYTGPLILDPVAMWLFFYMPRPKWHFRKSNGVVMKETKARAPVQHQGRPDATKLVRAAEDALKGVVWGDDSQVVYQLATKEYADNCGPGVMIVIRKLPHGKPLWLCDLAIPEPRMPE